MKNLHFANGVELASDESFILVAETIKYRVLKYEAIISLMLIFKAHLIVYYYS